ncbi:hypothetical protein Bca52824_025881 [Brassica carinata]|uniref:Uncharacterized protein n=1 Tax=Brassica carinata TaxID=52824 RepID=A0A8X7SH12_BRACI|nr:hypothetical protein Bca52824_025881 [Brassica carinata]
MNTDAGEHRSSHTSRLGMVTPLGRDVETRWRRLTGGDCGIRGLTPDDLKMNSFDDETKSYTFDQLSSKVAAFVHMEQTRTELLSRQSCLFDVAEISFLCSRFCKIIYVI